MMYFYSPLPPTKTGPADYMETLLESMEREAGEEIKARVVLLYEQSESPIPEKLLNTNWNVRDYKSVAPTEDDTCVYFLASNLHHYFVFDALNRQGSARRVAVIHDLAAGFLIRDLRHIARSSVGAADLLEAFEFDFGHRASAVLEYYEEIHPTVPFFIMAHGLTVNRTDRVYVHSYYAKSRLLFESTFDLPIEKIRVVAFPRRPLAQQSNGKSNNCDKFRVSMLGFYHEAKRYPSVLTAWNAFAQKLSTEERRNIELIVGGELADDVRKSLECLVADEPVSKTVRFVGYTSDEDLDEFIMTSSLVVNLRFPSWGETSAMVHRVIELGCPLVVSAFAGYHEEPAVRRISVDPIDEVDELIDLFEKAFALWHDGNRLENITPPNFGSKLDLTREMIALAID